MLLTIATTHTPATDLGFLLHKHPDRVQTFPMNFGNVHVLYPEANEQRCTVALILDIDPVALVRGRGMSNERTLDQYVNDRPYVASSFMSVAIKEVFSSAMAGQSRTLPELTTTPIPLEIKLDVVAVRSRDGADLLQRLFAPLDYSVEVTPIPLDRQFKWGDSAYFKLKLTTTKTLRDALNHIYVLLPVLDNDKHYWFGRDEVEKLLAKGEGWLAQHPERELITTRYLRYQKHLTRDALSRLSEDVSDPDRLEMEHNQEEQQLEAKISLHQQRHGAVLATLKAHNVQRIVDVGCGEGLLILRLLDEPNFTEILGMDVSYRALESAQRRLERVPELKRRRARLIHGSLVYRDQRLSGFDAATVVEVIEHLDASRLATFERVLFESAQPNLVIITTPNREYNVLFPSLPAGTMRHRDHRFEWSRAEFEAWANALATRYGYYVTFLPIGDEHPEHGAPSQMGVFRRDIA